MTILQGTAIIIAVNEIYELTSNLFNLNGVRTNYLYLGNQQQILNNNTNLNILLKYISEHE